MNQHIAYEAMMFAREAHATQRRKYTGEPYITHLADVVAISMSIGWHEPFIHPDKFMAVGWLHDSIEDVGITYEQLADRFGLDVAAGVMYLSDLETGNRAARKAASRARLAGAPGWIQTIKVADLISNTGSIVEHDPEFAKLYLEEKRELLEVLTKADTRLLAIAREIAGSAAA